MSKKMIIRILTVLVIVACLGLMYAGQHGAAMTLGALPFVFGATKVRDAMDMFRTMKYTAGVATVTDTVYLLGGRVLLALNTVAISTANMFLLEGVIEYAKVSAQAWTAGATIYWDDTAKNFTTVVGANTKCGIAMEDAANPSATGLVYLVPSP